MNTITRPAIVRTAEDLTILAAEINAEHEAGERATRQGLEHFRAAGERLLRAKAACGHGKWLAGLTKNVRFNRITAWGYMRLAQEWEKCSTAEHLRDALRLLTADAPDDDEAKVPHVAHASGEHEWYTPPDYLAAARAVLGTLDLDPASSAVAQQTVQAGCYFTAEDDGLSHAWAGTVCLNPPYAVDLVGRFVAKLCHHVRAGDVPAGVMLVNNATETQWFREAAALCSAMCCPTGRIRFVDRDGEPSGAPLQGQALMYFGPEPERFVAAFARFGSTWTPAEELAPPSPSPERN
jgi:ParB family chromosome partitioning protein